MQARGFTLVEVLVVMTISAILLALAVPSFVSSIRRSEIASSVNSVLAAMDLSRSEAIRRNTVVVLCRSINPQAPQPACSVAPSGGYAADDWAVGWVAFAKQPGLALNTQFQAGDEVILRQAPIAQPTQTRLIAEFNQPLQAFAANGLFAVQSNGTFFIDYRDTAVATRSNMARCVVVNRVGRPRVAGVVNDLCPAA